MLRRSPQGSADRNSLKRAPAFALMSLPRTGARIEIPKLARKTSQLVAPRTGARIETSMNCQTTRWHLSLPADERQRGYAAHSALLAGAGLMRQ
jgi:hypothetical protein